MPICLWKPSLFPAVAASCRKLLMAPCGVLEAVSSINRLEQARAQLTLGRVENRAIDALRARLLEPGIKQCPMPRSFWTRGQLLILAVQLID